MLQPTTQLGAVRPQIDFSSAMLLLAWAAFVVYGSLVPLDFRALAWDQVARDFLGHGHAELQPRSLLTGGAPIAAAMTGSRMAAAPVWWLLSAAVLLPIPYWSVVTQAATANGVESKHPWAACSGTK